jgi:DNA-binding response OmpR family regulator
MKARHRLLIVEDEASVIFALREFFTVSDYDVDCAAGSVEAERLLTRNTYDLLITDLHLTAGRGSEGLHVLGAAQKNAPNTRTVMLTAFCSADVRRTAEQFGASAVLAKPIELPKLAALVLNIMDGGRTR